MGSPPPSYKTDLEPCLSNESEPVGLKLCKLNKFTISARDALASSPPSDKDAFIASIPNDTYYGAKTRLELASKLARPQHIFDIWKSEDTTLLHYSLDILWIYRDSTASPLVSNPDFVVQDLFPSLPSSCRRKVARRMGKWCLPQDAPAITEIYSKLNSIYGIKLTNHLLPACTQGLIESVIEAKQVKFDHNQLFLITKKYPETGLKYLNGLYQELDSNSVGSSHHHHHRPHTAWINQFFSSKDSCPLTLKHILKTNPTEFLNLCEKYDSVISSTSVGHRMTKNLINQNKTRIISSNKASAYARMLCHQGVMRRLSETEFDGFFVKLFPQNVREFQTAFEIGESGSTSLFTWLKKYAPEKRFPKLDAAFKSSYGKSVLDFSEHVTSKMLQILSPEERNKWVDFRISQPDPGTPYLFNLDGVVVMPAHLEGYWVAFKTTDVSIPRIKQYLATESDVHKRSDLLSSLVITCFINQDKSALKDICQFVSTRFRNDTAQVRLEFLSTLSSLFNLLKLEEDHWKPINELLHISSINSEFSYRPHILESLVEKSIHFRVARGQPVDTQIQHYIKMKSRSFCTGESWCIVSTQDPSLERKCLKLFTEHLTSIYPLTPNTPPYPSDSAITSAIISLFESYAGWNRRYKSMTSLKSKNGKDGSDLLSATESPWLITRLQQVLDSYHEYNKNRVISAMNHDPQAKAALHQKLVKSNPVPSIVIGLIRKDPKKMDTQMDQILDFMLASNHIREWEKALNSFRSAGLPQLMTKFGNKCLEIADDEEESLKERTNSVYILSFILDPTKFMGWIPKYYPTEDSTKFDHYTAEEIGVIYGIRKMICSSLANLSNPSSAIPALAEFCKGDYLKLTVGSIYSIVEKAPPTQKLTDFLQNLANRPVSVKKHAIRLMISISKNEERINFFKNLWTSEKHHSIRTILFHRIFEFFIQNNSEESWNLLESTVQSLDVADEPFLSEMARRDFLLSPGMPNSKISSYLKLALNKVDSLVEAVPAAKWVKVSLLQCIIPGNIGFLEEESFIHSIFEKHLFNLKDEPELQSALVTLALQYLLYFPGSSNKMEKITIYLGKLLGSAWTTASKDSYTSFPAKRSLTFFVEQLVMSSFHMASPEKVEKAATSDQEIINIFTQLQKYLRSSSRDVCEFFVVDLFLSFALISHTRCPPSMDDEKRGGGGGNNMEAFVKLGKEMGKLVDETVKAARPEVVPIFSEALDRFISLCYGSDDESVSRIIFIGEGIINSTGSIDTQIVASQLLLNSSFGVPPKGHKFEEKYVKIINQLKESKDKTVQIFWNYGTAQSRSNRGFDILV